MAYPRCYQPELPPFLIKAIHHEAKLRGVPMTKLLREIVSEALRRTEGMQRARQEIQDAGNSFLVDS